MKTSLWVPHLNVQKAINLES